ncbi:MAG: Glu-tRNA(Gln) amidotransferase subunit GatD [Candidatus Aenigmatarchaeota archaeon]
MYSHSIEKILKKKKIEPGDQIRVFKEKNVYAGTLMPKTETSDANSIIIKLSTGYNIGIGMKFKIEKTGGKAVQGKLLSQEIEFDPKKPTISILHTGGTIAARVDYRTGGVVSAFSPEDLLTMFPELKEIANTRTRLVKQIFSEEMHPAHYQIIAKEIAREIKSGVDGIIIGHGTDTLHYTSAMLSFMLQDVPIPVILVGAQRSSDRGSSDAAMNLICAAKFIAKTDFSGVGVCMHATPSDEACWILHGCKVRKMHTSKRDAFQPVGAMPVAKVGYLNDEIEFYQGYKRRDKKRPLVLKDNIEPKVALIKSHPGISPKLIEILTQEKYRGLLLEGTGLGHTPANEIDEFTASNKRFFDNIRRFIHAGGVAAMASQTIYGRVNMNVYSTGRDLLSIGVVPCEDMTSETAFVKLMWACGQSTDAKKVKELMATNIAGEISERREE